MARSQIYFVASALLLALGSVLAKLLLSLDQDGGKAIDPLPFLTFQLIGGVAFLMVVQIALGGSRAPLHLLRRPALAGLILGVGSVGTIMALALISASEAAVVFATQPVVILVLARVLLGERCGLWVTALCLVAVVGVVTIVASGGVDETGARATGIAFAAVSTVSAALYVIWMRGLSDKIDVLTALLVVLSAATLLAALLWGVTHMVALAGIRAGTFFLAGSAFGTGVIYYGAAFYVYLLGLQHTEASRAGVYLSLVPVFVIALAWALLNERLTPLQWVGAAIVIGAVAGLARLSAGASRL